MTNRNAKAQARAVKRAKAQQQERSAQKAGLAAMQAKLEADAGPRLPELPRASVRERKRWNIKPSRHATSKDDV